MEILARDGEYTCVVPYVHRDMGDRDAPRVWSRKQWICCTRYPGLGGIYGAATERTRRARLRYQICLCKYFPFECLRCLLLQHFRLPI